MLEDVIMIDATQTNWRKSLICKILSGADSQKDSQTYVVNGSKHWLIKVFSIGLI